MKTFEFDAFITCFFIDDEYLYLGKDKKTLDIYLLTNF